MGPVNGAFLVCADVVDDTQANAVPDVPGHDNRWARVAYLFGISTVLGFFALLLTVGVIEAYGPSETDAGAVLERHEDSYTIRRCSGPGTGTTAGCRETTYPTFSVIGERQDGSTWIAVGEGVYEAMAGEGVVEVETSTITGRVVGLEGDDSWHISDSGFALFAGGGLVVCLALVGGYEWRRRSGRWDWGPFRPVEFVALVPALAIAAIGVWAILFSKAWGIDVITTQERGGGFFSTPYETGSDSLDISTLSSWTGMGAGRVSTIPVEALSDEQRAADPGGLIAVPVIREDPTGVARRVLWSVELEGAVFEPVACPGAITAYPTQLDSQLSGGFLCFDPAAVDGTLVAFHELGPTGGGFGERHEMDFDHLGL